MSRPRDPVPAARRRARTPRSCARAIDRVIARGWFVLGPEARGVRSGVRGGMRRRARGRRRHRHRRDCDCAARARHRPGRRGDHVAAVGGLHRARDHDGRRAAGVRRHRSRAAHDRSGGRRRGGHAAHARDPAGAPLRAAGRHAGDSRRSPRATAWRSSKTAARRTSRRATGGRSARFGVGGAPSASTRPRTSARSATAARVIDQRCGLAAERMRRLRNGGQTRSLPSRRVRRELAARRDAGGGPARPAAAAAGVDARRRAARARIPAAARRRRGRRRARPSSIRATSTICSRCVSTRRDGSCRPRLRARGDRDADSLSGADSASAGARAEQPADCPVAERRLRRGVFPAALPVACA